MSSAQHNLVEVRRSNPQRAVVLLVSLPIVAFLAFGVFVAMGYPSDRYGMIGLALLTIVISLVPILLDQGRSADRRHMLLSLYCLLFIVNFGIPIFTLYVGVRMPIDPPGVAGGALFPRDIVNGQAVALIALLSFLLAYGLLPSRLSPPRLERRTAMDWPAPIIPVVAVVMLIIGWTVAVAGQLGLIPAAIGTGVISSIGSSLFFGNALLAIAAFRHRSRTAWLMLFIAVPVSSVLGFFTGSKQNTLMVPAIVFFTAMLLGGRFRVRWILVGVISLMLLYPISEFYRNELMRGRSFTAADALSDPTYTLGLLSDFLSSSRAGLYLSEGLAATSGRLDAIGIESVIVRDTPSVSPFQYGRTLALFPIAFVPRLFWPSKPDIALGQWITDTYGSGAHITSHTGPSFIGDLYLNFGVASVVIVQMMLGALLRLFHTRFLGPNPTTVGILAAVIVIVQFHMKLIGSAGYVMSSTVFALAPVLILHFVVAFLVRGNAPAKVASWSSQDDSEVGNRF